MKKILLAAFSCVLAIGFSAFTPQTAKVTTYHYLDQLGNPQQYSGAPCQTTPTNVCKVDIGTERFQIFYDLNRTLPVPGED